jgi:uncharacterized protein RhaS with RHS repeats
MFLVVQWTNRAFTQEDPIGIAGGLNLYGYANGDPINFSDPFGLCPTCFVGGVLGVGTGWALSTLLGVEYDLKDAAIDFAFGAAGAGIATKLDKISDARRAIRATAHGADRMADASRLGQAGVQDVLENFTQRFAQSDGARVFVKEVDGRFHVVVHGERGVITNLKNLSEKSLDRLRRNYGWEEIR